MKFRTIPGTGLFVSELCLGAMTFGGSGTTGPWATIGGLDQKAVDELVNHSLDAGINFFDTADVYSQGVSESLLGSALKGRRKDVILATKVRGRFGRGANQVGLSRVHILEQVEGSLKRLGTDYIDLYQIHRGDEFTDVEDTMRTLDDLVRSGKVRYLGCSNLHAWQIMKSLGISRLHNLEHFRTTQSYYSLAGRELEREIIPLIEDQKLGLMVWSPLAGGFLSGKFTRGGTARGARRDKFDFPPVDKEKAYAIVDVLADIAKAHSSGVAPTALAWVLANKAVTSVIIGAKNPAQLTDNIKSIDITLSPEELKRLDEVSRIAPEYPAWMGSLGNDRKPGESRY